MSRRTVRATAIRKERLHEQSGRTAFAEPGYLIQDCAVAADVHQGGAGAFQRAGAEGMCAAVRRAGRQFVANTTIPWQIWAGGTQYAVDFAQRSVLLWDALRQRGNNFIEHERQGLSPVLHFDCAKLLLDAFTHTLDGERHVTEPTEFPPNANVSLTTRHAVDASILNMTRLRLQVRPRLLHV